MPLDPAEVASLTADAPARWCSRGCTTAGCEADRWGEAERASMRVDTCASR